MSKSSIPLIDLQSRSRSETAGKIFNALHNYGFMYVVGHGVDGSLQKELEDIAIEFFEREEQEKLQWRMENYGLHWRGYFPVGAELTSGKPDIKEGFYLGTDLDLEDQRVQNAWPMHGPNPWPNQKMKRVISTYMCEVRKLAHQLLSLVATGLELPENYFDQRFTHEPTELFRIFSYPAQDHHDESWGVQEHTDMGFLTILKQDDLGGLQVKGPDGDWLEAPPIKDSFVINIGDMLELWTSGILKATRHRVKNVSGRARFSFPYFFDPNWNAPLERIDRSLLPSQYLEQASQHESAETRWDSLDLSKINAETSYGEFVWEKVKTVFPQLVPKESE